MKAGNIFLVGLMGAGKTTVGRLLARRLKLRFFDSDLEIERRCGVKIRVIFEIEGEAGFRGREEQVIAELVNTSQAAGLTPGTQSTSGPGLNTDFPAGGLNNFTRGQFSMVLFNSAVTRLLNVEISALESDGKGKIIASPRVLTADQVEAVIEQGTEIPYQQSTSSGATAVSFRKANLALKVKPQITPDDNIIMTLDVNKDQPGATTSAGVQINTKHVKTEVLVENGGTVVIGGIYEQTDRTDITRIPFLGELPFLGFLFRNDTSLTNKTELLVFITPRIVNERLTIR